MHTLHDSRAVEKPPLEWSLVPKLPKVPCFSRSQKRTSAVHDAKLLVTVYVYFTSMKKPLTLQNINNHSPRTPLLLHHTNQWAFVTAVHGIEPFT